MKAGPILALVLLVVIAGAAGYYYLYNFYGLQSSTSTTRPSTSCPPGQVLINGACSSNCANGATDPPSCNVFPPCTNGAANPPSCNVFNQCTNGATNPPTCTSTVQCTDPGGINGHVYHPARLTLVNSCITASGIVDRVLAENDGDLHVRLTLDSAYSNLTNNANNQYQYGDLVVEIICVGPVTQADAVSACQNYTNNILIPRQGQHITVTGPYVLDTVHNNWAEIHPVYSLKIDPSTSTTVHITSESTVLSEPKRGNTKNDQRKTVGVA